MTVNAFWLMLGALGVYAIFYKYYSAFIAIRVMQLNDARVTPAHRLNDGQNYHPTNKYVLWGHHFAAIAGAGPLIGPVLAAQFGYLPGFLWLVFGVCLAGAVQDCIILIASTRRSGRSLAEIARTEISPLSGLIAMVAILFIVTVLLAVLGKVVVNALADSPWGAFTILMSIPIAFFMGWYMYRFRKGKVGEASAIGVALLFVMVILGGLFQKGGAWEGYSHYFKLSENGITTSMVIYGFIASVLPVWLLLCPRDYLSTYMKVGTVALIVLAVLAMQPAIRQPAFANLSGGFIVKGPLFPFVFITIACGAISGFHSLVSSGTTPKMIDKETQCRPIGYGAMLVESLVGVTALIAACSLPETHFYGINLKPEDFTKWLAVSHLDNGSISELSHIAGQLGEANLAGRTGGGVSLAVGIATMFRDNPFLSSMMAYLYHFVIMFEALFVLTTLDTGTRIMRFLVQEFGSRAPKNERLAGATAVPWAAALAVTFGCVACLYAVVAAPAFGTLLAVVGLVVVATGCALLALNPHMMRTDWGPGSVAASALVVAGWSYFIYTGTIQTLWPIFGVANQLLAIVALTVATTVLINEGRSKYAWVTILPMIFVGTTTLTAGVLSIKDIFLPLARAPKPGAPIYQGQLLAVLTTVMMVCVIAVLVDAVPRWLRHWKDGRRETRAALELPSEEAAAQMESIGILEPSL